MAMRVKNIEAGYWKKIRVGRKVISKFFPIRSSSDYDPSRAHTATGETEAQRKKRAAKKAAPKKKKAVKRATKKAAKKTTKRTIVSRGIKRTVRASTTKKKAVKRSKNPIPVNFTDAKVRRLPSGDIQVMILK